MYPCSGQPLPTTAPAMITISGTVIDRGISSPPLAGATLKVMTRTGTMLGMGTSDANGLFSIMITTGGLPVDGYVQATAMGHIETDAYPAVPWSADWDLSALNMVTPGILTVLAAEASITVDMTKAQIFVGVQDCSGNGVDMATVSSNPMGQVVYLVGQSPDSTATSTDPQGFAVIANVTPGPVTANAMANSTTFRERAFTGVAGVASQIIIQP
jgi:hypothetical protein